MKEKLKSAMKPAPERFAYNIQTAVNEAVSQNTKVKKHMSVGSRAVIAIALILVMIPTTVFGASKLYELVAKPVDSHGLELDNAEAVTGIQDFGGGNSAASCHGEFFLHGFFLRLRNARERFFFQACGSGAPL